MLRGLSVRFEKLAVALVATCALCGCRRTECVSGKAAQAEVGPVAFGRGDPAHYVYWDEGGTQRVASKLAAVPEAARGATVVYLSGKTAPIDGGAIGWWADFATTKPTARLRSLAWIRARAHAAWSGAWQVQRMVTELGVLTAPTQLARSAAHGVAAEVESRATGRPKIERRPAAEPSPARTADAGVADAGSVDAGGIDMAGIDAGTRAAEHLSYEKFRAELADDGLSVGTLELAREMREVDAKQPLPRDFGLSMPLRPAWLFVDESCGACDQASAALDKAGIAAHLLKVSDPTNAASLRTLSKRAGVKPAVPTLWIGDRLVRGFAPGAYAKLGHHGAPK